MCPLNTLYLIYINIYTKDDGQGCEITYKPMEEIHMQHITANYPLSRRDVGKPGGEKIAHAISPA